MIHLKLYNERQYLIGIVIHYGLKQAIYVIKVSINISIIAYLAAKINYIIRITLIGVAI